MSGRVGDEVEVLKKAIMEEGRNIESSGGNHSSIYIHKVGAPPKQNLVKEIKDAVRETFFSDNPLRHFKHQPAPTQLRLGLQALFPILDWGTHYNLTKFKGDLISGLTIASLCIPQVIYN